MAVSGNTIIMRRKTDGAIYSYNAAQADGPHKDPNLEVMTYDEAHRRNAAEADQLVEHTVTETASPATEADDADEYPDGIKPRPRTKPWSRMNAGDLDAYGARLGVYFENDETNADKVTVLKGIEAQQAGSEGE